MTLRDKAKRMLGITPKTDGQGREISPPTRLERILRDHVSDEADRLDAEWRRLNEERDR